MSKTEAPYTPIIDGDLALAIGNLVTEWAGAQFMLVRALADLMVGRSLKDDDDMNHAAVIFGMEARVLIGLVKTLVGIRLDPRIAEKVRDLLDGMEGAKDLRDFVCHCLWTHNKRGKWVAVQLKTVGKIKRVERAITVTEIIEKIALLHESAHSLLGYLHASGYMKSYAPSLERPY